MTNRTYSIGKGLIMKENDFGKFWFKDKYIAHREDGPATEWWNGKKSWYLDNIRYTEEEWKRIMIFRRLEEL